MTGEGQRVVAIVQARMSSTRLPGKVLKPLAGAPALGRLLDRLARARLVNEICVATSEDSSDDAIARFCTMRGTAVTRGSLDDVLLRYHRAAAAARAEVVVRVTGDCPLVDPVIVDQHVMRFLAEQPHVDYVSNVDERSYPDGLDVEVFSFAALDEAGRAACSREEREHVTPWIRRHKHCVSLVLPVDLSHLRWTVDYVEDYQNIDTIFRALVDEKPDFGAEDVYQLLITRPELLRTRSRGELSEDEKERNVSLIRELVARDNPMSGPELYRRAKSRIPGGTQLLSKRPEMFLPEEWPAYYERARGAEVWDLNGRRYLDMTLSAIGACPLGFADPDVDAAVKGAIDKGVASTLNCPEEVQLAEVLCELHPWAEMVRYARSGGEAMAIAVRIARAASGRDKVAFCGYHGWHDWYLAANLASDKSLDGHLLPGLEPAGVPRGLLGSALPFAYNNRDELDAIIDMHGRDIGVICAEPVRYSDPEPGFLEYLRRTASRIGAVLIFDEITAAFRMNVGGAHLRYGVMPDLAVFAKGMGNGYPIAAIIGTREIMDAAQRTFISSTNWTERVGPTAALATIGKMRAFDVPSHLIEMGNLMRAGWETVAARHGMRIHVKGLPPLSSFVIEHEKAPTMATVFTRRMLAKGFLATTAFYATYAHQPHHVEAYVAAADGAVEQIMQAQAEGRLEKDLVGPPRHTGFHRLA